MDTHTNQVPAQNRTLNEHVRVRSAPRLRRCQGYHGTSTTRPCYVARAVSLLSMRKTEPMIYPYGGGRRGLVTHGSQGRRPFLMGTRRLVVALSTSVTYYLHRSLISILPLYF
ncbi:hypothetical protein J6590_092728 [Homalodisca vitripennis]|nr:hypothetical protein J6590_092728 [Homalodisca vitripennis]